MNLMSEFHYECERKEHHFPCFKSTKELLITYNEKAYKYKKVQTNLIWQIV